MNYSVRRWRSVLRVIAIVLALAVPLPALAADGVPPAAKPGIRASIGHAVASARVTASPGKASATSNQSQTTPDAKLGSKSFFKTPVGVAVLAVVGAGAGYAIYSTSHDRIHSVVRSGQ